MRQNRLVKRLRSLIPNALVNLLWHWPIALVANVYYGWPSKDLVVIGVTGTDGKTTTATYLHHLLSAAGFNAALITTVGAKIGQRELDTGLHITSPSPFVLQKLLSLCRKEKISQVVLEVTSHGLEQNRTWGIAFTGGILTNITEDHLDYHGTWMDYLRSKAKLFRHTRFAVLNRDDKSYNYMLKLVAGKIISYGGHTDYNKLNLLAAEVAAQEIGVSKAKIASAIKHLPVISGRMEVMQDKPYQVIVDFAHTPNALLQVLKFLRKELKSGCRLWAIFGCAGERDVSRRRMGMVSAKLADITVITAEDPRSEGVKQISAEIAEWAEKGGAEEIDKLETTTKLEKFFIRIPDRKQAIRTALYFAGEGDIVGIFGKGHEKSMNIGGIEHSWSDQETVRQMLKEINAKQKLGDKYEFQ